MRLLCTRVETTCATTWEILSQPLLRKTLMKNTYWLLVIYLCASLSCTLPAHAENDPQDLMATTPQGDKVILHPNGRWEFTDTKKAIEAKEVAKQFPENQGCPPSTQGGLLGLGRCIPVGDKDYNRGSLTGKGR